MNRFNKFDRLLILLSGIFILIDITGVIMYITKVNRSSTRLTSSVKASINKESVASVDSIQIIKTSSNGLDLHLQERDIYGTTMQYTSYQLGLRFRYLNQWGRKSDPIEDKPTTVFVSRNVNKVCITYSYLSNGEDCINGQYILSFKKDTKISFERIIKEDILNNNTSDCVVNMRQSGDKEIATIVPLTDKCTDAYSKRGVDRYFQYDSRFPDRYVFVSLGQQPIFADTNHTTWEMTLELL